MSRSAAAGSRFLPTAYRGLEGPSSSRYGAPEMSMRSAVLIAALSALASCSGGGSKATVDGASKDAGTGSITYEWAVRAEAGSVVKTATLMSTTAGGTTLEVQAGDAYGNMLLFVAIPATPESKVTQGTTYPVAPAAPNAAFQFTDGSGGSGTWISAALGTSGHVTITTLTATEVAGNFTSMMVGVGADASAGVGEISAGEFDLPLE